MKCLMIVTTALALMGAGVPVWAAETEWAAHPVTVQGRVSHCLAEKAYTDGRQVQLAIRRDGRVNLGLTVPGNNLTPQGRYALVLRLDHDKSVRQVTGRALSAVRLAVDLGQDAAFMTALGSAQRLEVQGLRQRTEFGLGGGKVVLGQLDACTAKAVAVSAASRPVPPVLTSPQMKEGELASQGAIKAEKTETKAEIGKEEKVVSAPPSLPSPPHATTPDIQNSEGFPGGVRMLLAKAGLAAARPLDLSAVPEDQRPADISWTLGPVFGGIRERQAPEGVGLQDLIRLYVDAFRQQCQGAFQAPKSRVESLGTLWLATGQVVCATEREKVFVGLLYTLTQDGLFTVILHEGRESDKATVLKARDALGKAVRDVYAGASSRKPARAKSG